MNYTTEETRVIRYWKEQRKGGKAAYVAVYTFGYFFVIFMIGVALGLFSGLPFVTVKMLIGLAIVSLTTALLVSLWQWRRLQQKYDAILQKHKAECN